VEGEVDVVERSGVDPPERGDAAPAVCGGGEAQSRHRSLTRPLHPALARHRALQPVLARARLAGDLLRVAALLVGAEPGRASLAAAGLVARRGDVRLEPAAALGLGFHALRETRAAAGALG